MNAAFSTGSISRRDVLRSGAATLLAFGLWPGALRAQGKANPGSFHFVVLNDAHYNTPQCGPFLETVVEKISAGPKPELCLFAGDMSHHGTTKELSAVKAIFGKLNIPVHTVIGNHDYIKQNDRSGYEEVFPGRLNYFVEHKGWQIVALDTTEGLRGANTSISKSTLNWVDETLPKLERSRPTIILSHFPLGERISIRPRNADQLLERFLDFNLLAVFCGHYHAFTERHHGESTFTTNRCCSISQPNHDKTKGKGYFLCHASEGAISREFVLVATDAVAPKEEKNGQAG